MTRKPFNRKTFFRCFLPVIFLQVSVFSPVRAQAENKLLFNRDIRPILSEHCFQCHGPDQNARQAELRLDSEVDVLKKKVIVPGESSQSPVYLRMISNDEDERMPPADSSHQLSSSKIELIKQWIDQGAVYQKHWSLIPLTPVPLPDVPNPKLIRNEIDAFVLKRLEKEGLSLSPQAEKTELIRRVTFDLTGLPPTLEEIDNFVSDKSENAYEKLVDRLLESPQYGERMAMVWMDAARFADSGGYQGDILRSMWQWRDWVIDAYNKNMPFDQFTTEQLAGDLLPEPTLDQQIATGFNRNHRINDEDGIIFEEYRVEYVADRVETTGAVWLGLTIGCCRCHDHKYDPVTQKNYYELFAFFNSINEKGRGNGNAPPLLQLPSEDQKTKLAELNKQIQETKKSEADEEQKKKLENLNVQKTDLVKSIPTLMVMKELPEPRETFLLVRGAYDRPGEKVTWNVPESISPEFKNFPNNRLGLAQWILSKENPLTARVAVNRYWQMYFGTGIVKTTEDFGSQGDWPTHPELLDWLANRFIDSGWDIKALQKLIVTSATYRQSSRGTEKLYQTDPENRLLARGPRFRLPAEMIRDMALHSSGLLVDKIGGPPVRPYQPKGLWAELMSNSKDYHQAKGEGLYRRSLYTFVRRTVPPPAMKSFDAPDREICTLRRPRTNTPLQALVLMNDPTYVEASRILAQNLLLDSKLDPEKRIEVAFRKLTGRTPNPDEVTILKTQRHYFLDRYQKDPEAAKSLNAVGDSPVDPKINPSELAAWSALCSLIMNLDETITKE